MAHRQMTRIHTFPPMPLLADPPTWNEVHAVGLPPLEVGRSYLGNSINLYHAMRANILVLGGVHGDESEGIFLAQLLLRHQSEVPVLPCLNPDGAMLRQRWNGRNVDLNRNLPTSDWKAEALNPRYPPGSEPGSEPETAAFLHAMDVVGPSMVLSLHSFGDSFLEVERPPDSLPDTINILADEMVRGLKIERKNSVGYPTPGALGSFAWANGLLVFTLELQRGASHNEIFDILPIVLRFIARANGERFSA